MRTKIPVIWLLLSIIGTAAMAETFRGELTARYRDRWGSSDWSDQDLFTYFRLSFGNETDRGIGGSVSLRWDQDLLTRANETRDGSNDLRVYYAYVDLNQLQHFDFRLGRQILDEAEGFNITGAKGVYSGDWKHFRLGLFTGQPVSYTTGINRDEWASGLTWSLRPDTNCQVRGSWIHVADDQVDNDVVTLGYRRSFAQGSNLWAAARTLDFDVFNEVVGGSWQIAPANLLLTGTYRRQEDTNVSTSRYFGGLSTIIGPSRPYQNLILNLSRPIGDLASVGVGYGRRDLLHATENRGNQEYRQFFADVFLTEKLLAGFEANVNFSRWQTDHDSSSTFSGSVGHRFGEHLKVELGSSYAKYDLRRVFDTPDEVPTERYDVRTNYLRGDWKVRKRYRVRVDFDRTTDSTSKDAYYEVELRLGLDLALLGKGFAQ